MKHSIIYHFHIHGNYIDVHDNQQVTVGGLEDERVSGLGEKSPAPDDSAKPANDILSVPPEGNYTAVRKYIEERVRFDEAFRTFVANKSRVALCKRLSDEFGWTVDHYALGRNINRNRR